MKSSDFQRIWHMKMYDEGTAAAIDAPIVLAFCEQVIAEHADEFAIPDIHET
jgi:hypothetical protein